MKTSVKAMKQNIVQCSDPCNKISFAKVSTNFSGLCFPQAIHSPFLTEVLIHVMPYERNLDSAQYKCLGVQPSITNI